MLVVLCEKREQGEKVAAAMGLDSRGKSSMRGTYNGENATVCWAAGHLFSPVEPEKVKEDCNWFNPSTLLPLPTPGKMEVSERGKDLYKNICEILKTADTVWIATDADREGEAIARDILKYAKFKGDTKRLWLSGSLEPRDVQKAILSIIDGDKKLPLWRAQQARQGADWLWQFLVRGYTIKGRAGLMGDVLGKEKGRAGVVSVGRVQTATLKMIVARDQSIANFKPIKHYTISALLAGVDWNYKVPSDIEAGQNIKITDDGVYFLNKPDLDAFSNRLAGAYATIQKADKGQKVKHPPLPYSLTSLQRYMSQKYGLPSKKTLELADKIRLDGYLTYPRTEHGELPEGLYNKEDLELQMTACAAIPELKTAALDMLRKHPCEARPKCYSTKPMEHHGIVPTGKIPDLDGWNLHEKAIFEACAKALVTALHQPAIYDTLTASFLVEKEGLGSENPSTFERGFSSLKEPGWLAIAGGENNGDDTTHGALPDLKQGEKHQIESAKVSEKETKPLKHFTESTLLGAMLNAGREATGDAAKILREVSGIGTPATRANILETLSVRGYVEKKKAKGEDQILSTKKGQDLIKFVPEILADVAVTAEWETQLKEIGNANSDEEAMGLRNEFLGAQMDLIEELIQEIIDIVPKGSTSNFSGKPTEKQAALVQKLASQLGIDVGEALDSFDAAKLFIDEHIGEARNTNPPTEKMIGFAKKLAREQTLEMPEDCEISFDVCKQFIDKALRQKGTK